MTIFDLILKICINEASLQSYAVRSTHIQLLFRAGTQVLEFKQNSSCPKIVMLTQ